MVACQRPLTRCWLAAIAVLAVAGGCQTIHKRTIPHRPDLSAARKLRKADAVRGFEDRRTTTELAAARSCLQQGDRKRCRDLLQGVLDREPHQTEARQLLAQLETDTQAAQVTDAGVPQIDILGMPRRRIPGSAIDAPKFATRSANRPPSELLTAAASPTPGAPQKLASPADVLPAATLPAATLPAASLPAASLPAAVASWQSPVETPAPAGVQRAVLFEPLDDAARRQWLASADRALAAGDVESARRTLQAALSVAPDDQELAVSMTVLLLRNNQPDVALELAVPALQRLGPSAELFRAIATAHYRRGEYEVSQVALQQALSLDNAHPLTYLLMGHTLSKLGDQEAARWHLQLAQRLGDSRSAAP